MWKLVHIFSLFCADHTKKKTHIEIVGKCRICNKTVVIISERVLCTLIEFSARWLWWPCYGRQFGLPFTHLSLYKEWEVKWDAYVFRSIFYGNKFVWGVMDGNLLFIKKKLKTICCMRNAAQKESCSEIFGKKRAHGQVVMIRSDGGQAPIKLVARCLWWFS